jgi:hypothetical protein
MNVFVVVETNGEDGSTYASEVGLEVFSTRYSALMSRLEWARDYWKDVNESSTKEEVEDQIKIYRISPTFLRFLTEDNISPLEYSLQLMGLEKEILKLGGEGWVAIKEVEVQD